MRFVPCCALLAFAFPLNAIAQQNPSAQASLPIALLFAAQDGDYERFRELTSEGAMYSRSTSYDASISKPLALKDMQTLLNRCQVLNLGHAVIIDSALWYYSKWLCDNKRAVLFRIEKGRIAGVEDTFDGETYDQGNVRTEDTEPRTFIDAVTTIDR